MPPNLKQNVPAMVHQTIREGETFRVNTRSKDRYIFREVVGVRESKYGPRTQDGTWNTANGFGWIEYRQYGMTGTGTIKECDSYDWVKLLGNMSKVGDNANG
jgi:hypothetical protein